MKRLIGLLLLTCSVLSLSLSLVACKNEGDIPAGMQLVRGSDEYGYYFYCPEEWTVANDGNISVCYVSKLDPTSVLFTEAKMPSEALEEYFTKEVKSLQETFDEFTLERSLDKNVLFGNADEAYKSIYTYKHDDKDFRTMLIYVKHHGHFYIFTYTAQLIDKNGEKTTYEYYLDKVQSIIDNFKFVEKKDATDSDVIYTTDEDGYILISSKEECGFDLYVPGNYVVDNATGFVSASLSDGANISLTKPTYTGVTADNYWVKRKADLEALNITLTEIQIGKQIEIQGAKWAFLYEYEEELLGRQLHVYQVLIAVGNEGYVFTYSAPSDVYEKHLNEALSSLNKIGY